jgi:hypothetical protein
MDEELYRCIEAFVREQLWEPKGGLRPETRLLHDIGAAGLDGYEFMEAYAAEFDVDLTGFNFRQHFGDEGLGCLPLAPFHWLYLRLFDPERLVIPAVTLRDLTRWAEAGAWERQR